MLSPLAKLQVLPPVRGKKLHSYREITARLETAAVNFFVIQKPGKGLEALRASRNEFRAAVNMARRAKINPRSIYRICYRARFGNN